MSSISTTPFKFSHSRMATFRRCLQRYDWMYKQKYFPPSAMGQARGTAGHAALAVWHVDYDAEKATQAAWDNWSSSGYPEGPDWDQLHVALERYYVWSRYHDTFTLKVAEQKFDIGYEIEYVGSGGELLHQEAVFNGYIDGIVEEDGHLWLLENKFYKRMDNSGLEMDQQVSLYLLAAHLLNYEVSGVIYNMVRVGDTKVAEKEPVVRKRLHRNPAGLTKVQDEMLVQVKSMLDYEKGGTPYRTPTKDCSWDCAFHQACLSMTDDGQEPTELLITISNLRSTEENG